MFTKENLISTLSVLIPIGLCVVIGFYAARLESCNAKLLIANSRISELTGLVDQQNQSIDQLKAASDDERKAYAARLAEANKRAARLEAKAEDILALPTPPADQQCAAAEALLKKELVK